MAALGSSQHTVVLSDEWISLVHECAALMAGRGGDVDGYAAIIAE